MRLPRANVITLILFRPSAIQTSLGTLTAYSESTLEIKDFLDTDIPAARAFLKNKFAQSIRLRQIAEYNKPLTCECLVNGVPIDVFPNPDVKTDMRSLIRDAQAAAEELIAEENRLQAERAAHAAKVSADKQFTADMHKIRELASKYDQARLTNNDIVIVKL